MHLSTDALEGGLDEIRESPRDGGVVELIVRRPADGEREILAEGNLSLIEGLEGDLWIRRPSSTSTDGGPNPDKQLTLINARLSSLVAGGDDDRRALAGDQLHVDLDLSHGNLPAGTRLSIGGALIEVTAEPHTGCSQFASRFGAEALRFVNVGVGAELRLRGINTKVIEPGPVRVGDAVRKV